MLFDIKTGAWCYLINFLIMSFVYTAFRSRYWFLLFWWYIEAHRTKRSFCRYRVGTLRACDMTLWRSCKNLCNRRECLDFFDLRLIKFVASLRHCWFLVIFRQMCNQRNQRAIIFFGMIHVMLRTVYCGDFLLQEVLGLLCWVFK